PTQDASSGYTTSSAFDFDADGSVEIVYRDECWLRIYDGKTGKTLSAYAITSVTQIEGPAIADVDGDGRADIVVSSSMGAGVKCPETPEPVTGAPWTGYTKGIYVLTHPATCWAPARRVWNEHSYHVTNVNDDSSIPAKEKNAWAVPNGFRQQVAP